MAQISEQIDRFQHEFLALSEEALNDEEARKKLLGVLQQGVGTLESPLETLWRIIMAVSCDKRCPFCHIKSNQLVLAASACFSDDSGEDGTRANHLSG